MCHALLPKIHRGQDTMRVVDAYTRGEYPHVYTLSLSIRNKHDIHESSALFTSTQYIQSRDSYNKRYDKRKQGYSYGLQTSKSIYH